MQQKVADKHNHGQ